MVGWQNTPSTATPLNAANLDAAFAEKADAAATTAGLALKVDLTDTRLTDARTPAAHTQTASTITDFNAAVDARIPAALVVSAWITPTLGNGWVNAGTPYQPVRYRQANGMTEIQGLMGGGSTGVVFTLPTAYCPVNQENFITSNGAGATSVAVQTSGNVFLIGYIAGGTNAFVGLGGIRVALS